MNTFRNQSQNPPPGDPSQAMQRLLNMMKTSASKCWEDAGVAIERVPEGCLFFMLRTQSLGTSGAGGSLHTPTYVADIACLVLAAFALVFCRL